MRAKKAVITAAGRGTRMLPATRAIQKEMLPLIDRDGFAKPTLQIICESCVEAGIDEICIVVENGGQAPFRAHFAPITPDEARSLKNKPEILAQIEAVAALAQRISYVEQPSPEGFGHSVFQAKDFVGDDPFLLLLGDHVYSQPTGQPTCIAQMLDAGAALGGSVTGVRLEPEADVSVTGIVKGRALLTDRAADSPGQRYEILALQEKPSVAEVKRLATDGLPSGVYLGHFGLHLFTANIFAALGHLIENDIRVKNEYQLTSGQEVLLARAQTGDAPPYGALLVNGDRHDIGLPHEYLKTLARY